MSEPEIFSWGTTIESFVQWAELETCTVYFHNLAFDAGFIIDHLLRIGYSWVEENPIPGQFTSLISDMGKFYSVDIVWATGEETNLRDSLKKLPMTVASVAKTFNLDEGKGDIDYDKPRPIGYEPTEEEIDYLRRDCQIVAKAVCQLLDEGMTRLTVGSDSLAEYKRMKSDKWFKKTFPVLSDDMDSEIRKAYRGGFTYADPRHKGKRIGPGKVYDVNSLYPYIMYDRLLPYGIPTYHEGLPPTTKSRPLFIVSVTFIGKLKPNHIPCIQVKNNRLYLDTEYLTEIDEPTTLYCTNVDLELWQRHYDLEILSYNGGWSFKAQHGFFREYIDKWSRIKEEAEGGRRAIAKLHLNSLYGKFATNPNVTGKYPVLEDNRVKLKRGKEDTRNPVYTAVGVFITAYARELTLNAAQSNYEVFVYADTDSLHLLTTEHPQNLDIHPTRLGAWAHENDFSEAIFMRPKAYCEVLEGGKNHGAHDIHIAGLPERVTRKLNIGSMVNGAEFRGKLVPKRVPGGIVLKDTSFTLKF